MTSNLGCVGLGVDDTAGLADLIAELLPTGTVSRQPDGTALYIWRDMSGARLTAVTDRSGAIADVTPSYDGEPGADVAGLVGLHDSITAADVVEDGQVVTRMAVEVLPPVPVPDTGRATVTAFGLEVTFHLDEAAFSASEASLLTPDEPDRPRPAHLDAAMTWPPRFGAESFISYGLFGDAAEAEPLARLNGTVLSARSAIVAATGQTFHAVRVRTVGMEVDLCLAGAEHPTAPGRGSVVAGTVYLVADVERPPAARRRWVGRRGR